MVSENDLKFIIRIRAKFLYKNGCVFKAFIIKESKILNLIFCALNRTATFFYFTFCLVQSSRLCCHVTIYPR